MIGYSPNVDVDASVRCNNSLGVFFYSTRATCPDCPVCVWLQLEKKANPVEVVATPVTEILQCFLNDRRM